MERECGECKLCCKCLSIVEIVKPGGKWCPHAKGKGCDIYEDRPPSCKQFRCAWLDGLTPEEFRPDKVHAVFVVEGTPDIPIISCYEHINGIALASKKLRWCIENFKAEDGERLETGIISPQGERTLLNERLEVIEKLPPHVMFTLEDGWELEVQKLAESFSKFLAKGGAK